MTQEQKDLLINDLCGRLSHGVKCKILETNEVKILGAIQYDGENTLFDFWEDDQKIQYGYQLYLSEFKPCLLSLSSMTEEQKVEFEKMSDLDYECIITQIKNDTPNWTSGLNRINWLIKNHFDVYGLIPMGLAIDATGLNIY
jgi:hypothetical protein